MIPETAAGVSSIEGVPSGFAAAYLSLRADIWAYATRMLANDAGAPPVGRVAPIRGFGKLWRQPDVRAALGWATAPEAGGSGAVQDFAHGRLVWTSDPRIYVLYVDGTWQSFPDTSVDPATPASGLPSPRGSG